MRRGCLRQCRPLAPAAKAAMRAQRPQRRRRFHRAGAAMRQGKGWSSQRPRAAHDAAGRARSSSCRRAGSTPSTWATAAARASPGHWSAAVTHTRQGSTPRPRPRRTSMRIPLQPLQLWLQLRADDWALFWDEAQLPPAPQRQLPLRRREVAQPCDRRQQARLEPQVAVERRQERRDRRRPDATHRCDAAGSCGSISRRIDTPAVVWRRQCHLRRHRHRHRRVRAVHRTQLRLHS